MLFNRASAIPSRVQSELSAEEESMGSLHGRLESGFALTNRRLFAWRGTGVIGPIALRSIQRILVDVGEESIGILVMPRHAVHPPLVLSVRAMDRDKVDAFLSLMLPLLGPAAKRERIGPVERINSPDTWDRARN
jgi:hypothetical protein